MPQNASMHAYRENINVAPNERMLSAAAGGFLLARGLFPMRNFSLTRVLSGGFLLYRGLTGFCAVRKAIQPDKREASLTHNLNLRTAVTVDLPVAKVYNFWRRLENLPRFMDHIESVTPLDEKRSRWKATGPAGLGSVEWEARIVEDIPNERISWSSLPDAEIHNAGKVVFTDLGGGKTRVKTVITFRPPMGLAGEKVLDLFSPAFERMIKADLEKFKDYIVRAI